MSCYFIWCPEMKYSSDRLKCCCIFIHFFRKMVYMNYIPYIRKLWSFIRLLDLLVHKKNNIYLQVKIKIQSEIELHSWGWISGAVKSELRGKHNYLKYLTNNYNFISLSSQCSGICSFSLWTHLFINFLLENILENIR